MAKPVPPKTAAPSQVLRRTITVEGDEQSQRANSQNELKHLIRKALQQVVDRLGRVPTEAEVGTHCRYMISTIERYFGDLEKALVGVKIPPVTAIHLSAARDRLRRMVDGKTEINSALLLPPNVASRPDFRQVVLDAAARRNVVPRNTTEEMFVFQWLGLGSEYFRRHPLHRDTLVREFQESGGTTAVRLRKIKKLLLGEESKKSRPVAVYRLAAQGGNVIAVDLFDRPEDIPAAWQAVSSRRMVAQVITPPPLPNPKHVTFQWSDALKDYYPIAIRDAVGTQAVIDRLAAQGVAVAHVVERSYLNYKRGFRPRAGAEKPKYHFVQLHEYFGQHRGIDHLLAIARAVDPRFAELHSAVRLSFVTNPTRGEFHAMRLVPWDVNRPWEWDRLTAQYLFEEVDGQWKLRRHSGLHSETWAPYFIRDLQDSVRVANGSGAISLSWPDLQNVVATSELRHILFHRLWERDHPGAAFPRQFIFQVSKRMKGIQSTVAMALLDGNEVGQQNPAKYLAWLHFDDDGSGGFLRHSEGRNATELVESYLSEKGVVFGHVVERAVTLRMYNDVTVKLREAPSPELVLAYFEHHGRKAVWTFLENMRVVENVPDKLPPKVTLSGKIQRQSGIAVGSLRFQEGGYLKREKPNSAVFAVEWTLQADGDYHVTQSVSGLGKKIAAAVTRGEGTTVFAPDADDMVARAKELRQEPMVFVPTDENMCKPEPLTTPADLKKSEPLITVPVVVKGNVPGFAPTPLTPKDLATPPSEHRHAGPVSHTDQPASRPGSPLIIEPRGGDDEPVGLPLFIGQDIFLPEPPVGMVVAAYAVLGGVIVVAGAAMVVEVPAGIAAGAVRAVQMGVNVGRPILAY